MTDGPGASLQRQARALGDPTRHEVFRYLADAGDAVGVAELTEHFGLNHNAIRQHLAKLVDAGLVVERSAPRVGRGRPRLVYEVDPSADGRWGVTGPYERLSLWLAEVIRTGDSPQEVGRRAAAPGAPDRSVTDGDPLSVLTGEMARQGFDPVVADNGRTAVITLRACPFATAALADPATVCELHAGMVDGLLEGIDGLALDSFTAGDPRRGQCRLRVRLSR